MRSALFQMNWISYVPQPVNGCSRHAPIRLAVVLALSCLFALGCSGGSDSSEARPTLSLVRVAAASDLKYAMEKLIEEFQRVEPSLKIQPVFGSSGNVFAQISNGAPFDLFLSADEEYVARLVDSGNAAAEDVFRYAVGRLVLWVPASSPLDVSTGIAVLSHPELNKIAIANPQHAPYGRAAVSALQHWGVYSALENKLVYGENVSQAAQFVDSGGAGLGMIAISLARAPEMAGRGRYWELPRDAHPPILQAGAVMARTQNPNGARRFGEFLMSARGQAVLREFGFSPVED